MSASGVVHSPIWMLELHPLPERLSGPFVRLALPRVTERLVCSHLGLAVGRTGRAENKEPDPTLFPTGRVQPLPIHLVWSRPVHLAANKLSNGRKGVSENLDSAKRLSRLEPIRTRKS